MKNIPITKPFFNKEEIKAVEETIVSGWLVQGRKVKEFENLICKFTLAKFAAATTSCTTALHLALIACNVKAGDEVILPALTFIASANSVEYIGAKPVFVDIDLKTFNIDPDKIEKKITKKTKAIMPVHLFGLSADMPRIMSIARKYNLKVIEDAACAVGAFYKGKHVGTFGDAGCFSFHPRKLITCGEGGMITANDKKLDGLIRSLRDHGAAMDDLSRHKQNISNLPDYRILGYNYRLTDIQASIAVEQMKKLKFLLKDRIQKASYYDKLLKNIKFITTPFNHKDYVHGYQAYVCLVDNENLKTLKEKHDYRDALMVHLIKNGISTRIGTHCVPNLTYYKKKYKLKDSDFPNALKAEYLSLALPLYYGLSKEDVRHIAKQISEFINKN